MRRVFDFGHKVGGPNMTSLAEAERKFGRVVRSAGGTIFGIVGIPSTGGRQIEMLQIGTVDGFVKIAVPLNQPNIDAVLRERTSLLLKHAGELRAPRHPPLGSLDEAGARAASN
jgi:hypothetical protein